MFLPGAAVQFSEVKMLNNTAGCTFNKIFLLKNVILPITCGFTEPVRVLYPGHPLDIVQSHDRFNTPVIVLLSYVIHG